MYIDYKSLLYKICPNLEEAQRMVMSEFFHYDTVVIQTKKYKNPFRNDKNARCVFKYRNGLLVFLDNAGIDQSFNCFELVQKQFGVSFQESLIIVANRFSIDVGAFVDYSKQEYKPFFKETIVAEKYNKETYLKKRKEIKVEARNWNRTDSKYWKQQYGITLQTLKKFNVYPVYKYYLSNGYNNFQQVFSYDSNQEVTYSYVMTCSDGIQGIKIYTPYSLDNKKWLSNTSPKHIQGYEQLPETGDVLIIASSLKEVMSLYEIGYNAIAFQSESAIPDEDVMAELKERFNRLYFLYDLDEIGLTCSKKYSELFDVNMLVLKDINTDDTMKKIKDVSDFIASFETYELGQQDLKNWLNENTKK